MPEDRACGVEIILNIRYNQHVLVDPAHAMSGGEDVVRMMTVKEAAERWGVSERWVTGLCSSGRVPGAVKHGRSWSVPENTEKPSDRRSRDKQTRDVDRLPLPIGVSDYRTASTSYYYMDKTLLIRDFLDERPMVSLFTRPRGFGKTLNMDMLRVFFELSEKDTSVSDPRRYGDAERSTGTARENIRSSSSHSKIASTTPGSTHTKRSGRRWHRRRYVTRS